MGNTISANNTYLKKHLEDTSFNPTGDSTNRKIACANGLVSVSRSPILSKNTPHSMTDRIVAAKQICQKIGYGNYQNYNQGFSIGITDTDPCKINEYLGMNLGYCNEYGLVNPDNPNCNSNSVDLKASIIDTAITNLATQESQEAINDLVQDTGETNDAIRDVINTMADNLPDSNTRNQSTQPQNQPDPEADDENDNEDGNEAEDDNEADDGAEADDDAEAEANNEDEDDNEDDAESDDKILGFDKYLVMGGGVAFVIVLLILLIK